MLLQPTGHFVPQATSLGDPFHILPGTPISCVWRPSKTRIFQCHAIRSLGTSLGILQIRLVTIRWYHNNIPMILRYDRRRTADIVTAIPRFIT
jgi:hypothetical protein